MYFFSMKISYLLFLFFLIVSCGQKKEKPKIEHTQSVQCRYVRNEKNPEGKRIRIVEEEKFIAVSFQDSALLREFKGDDYFKGYLSCVSVDSSLGIYFNFKINSADAFQYYGLIKKNNKINFILSSGKGVEVSFQTTFSGSTNLSLDFTEYSTFSFLTKAQARQLLSEELERVVITWSKREEEYNVVNPRIFLNQLPCVQ